MKERTGTELTLSSAFFDCRGKEHITFEGFTTMLMHLKPRMRPGVHTTYPEGGKDSEAQENSDDHIGPGIFLQGIRPFLYGSSRQAEAYSDIARRKRCSLSPRVLQRSSEDEAKTSNFEFALKMNAHRRRDIMKSIIEPLTETEHRAKGEFPRFS